MRHYDTRISVLLLAALVAAPLAAQDFQTPVITSVLGATSYSDLMAPLTPSVTAGLVGVDGMSALGLVVTGSNFAVGTNGTTMVWVPSGGGCPIASCEFAAFASSPTLIYAYPPDALIANPDPGARVMVRNPGSVDSAPFPFPVNPPITIAALPTAYLNVPYSAYFTSGGTAPYMQGEIAPTGGAPGLGVQGSDQGGGNIVGTPTSLGVFQGSAYVWDAWGQSPSTDQYSVNVASLPVGVQGAPYLVQNPFAGAGPFTLTITSGSLPPGVNVTLANGVFSISGTPAALGQYTANVQVSETSPQGAGSIVVTTGTIQLAIVPPVSLVTTSIRPMPAYGSYSFAFSAASAAPPYVWSISAGALPAGLTLNPGTGAIGGTPTGPGSTFTVKVADSAGTSATRTFTLNYELQILNSTLPAGTAGADYAEYVNVSGGSGNYAVKLIAGALPAGLVLNSQGTISGLPTVAGTSTFTVEAADATDRNQTPVSQSYRLLVNPGALTVTTASPLPSAPMGPLSAALAAAGGVPPYSWAVSAGSLPPGGTLSPAGILGGAATAMGTYSFTVTVTDSAKTAAAKTFRIEITAPPLTITTDSLPAATVLAAYSAPLSATGGTPPYAWSATGLPSGLTVSGATIAGTPTAGGNFRLTLAVADSTGLRATGSATLSVLIPALTISSTTLPDGRAGVPYSTTLAASGGVPPYHWNLTAAPPAGFGLSTAGTLSGTSASAALLNFAVQVSDAQGNSAPATLALKIAPAPLTITTETLGGGTAGMAFARTLTAEGGTPPFTWTASLPPGLTIDPATGAIGGAPLAGGARTIDATVTDSAGAVAKRSYTVSFAMPALPGLLFGGVAGAAAPLAQPSMDLKLTGGYPLAIAGTVTLTFQPDSGADDPTILFANGKRTAAFTVAPGASAAIFTGPAIQFQTGTVAGVITLTASFQSGGMDITPAPAPSIQIRIAPGGPVITDVKAARSPGGITVQVWGYSTSREVARALFSFPTNDVTVQPASIFSAWYQGSSAAPFGGQFLFTQTFSVTGDSNAVTSVKVTLSNALGASNAVTAAIP